MKKIIVTIAFVLVATILFVSRQSVETFADNKITITQDIVISAENDEYDLTNLQKSISIENANVTISNIKISYTGNKIKNLITVDKNSSLTLQNVIFENDDNISSCYVYNRGKVTVNNCIFDNIKNKVDSDNNIGDIVNNSSEYPSVLLENVAKNNPLTISLESGYVFVNENSIIDGIVNLNLKNYGYESITACNDKFVGKVLVKGVNTFAGKFIENFKFDYAPDEANLKFTSGKYFESFFDKYYLDYAGILGVDENNKLSISNDYVNDEMQSGDIILTKFNMRMKCNNSADYTNYSGSEIYSSFIREKDGESSFYIGGKYSTARLFVKALKLYNLQNFRVSGKVVDIGASDNKTTKKFVLDDVTPLFATSNNYINYGNVSATNLKINIYKDNAIFSTQQSIIYLKTQVKDNDFLSSCFLKINLNDCEFESIDLTSKCTGINLINTFENENDIMFVLDYHSVVTGEINVYIKSKAPQILSVDVLIDKVSFEYSKTNYFDKDILTNCYPYYIHPITNEKVYLQSEECEIYKVNNGSLVKVEEIISAGDYKIAVSSKNTYIVFNNDSFDIEVSKIVLDVDFGNTKFTYNGSSHSIVPGVSNVLSGDDVGLKLLNNDNIYPGNYDVLVSVIGENGDNYVLKSQDEKITVIIGKGTIERNQIILESVDKTVEYDGNCHTIKMLNTIDGLSYATATNYRDAGVYEFSIVFTVDSKLYYQVPSIPVKLTILPKTIDLDYITIEDIYHTYDKTSVKIALSNELLNSLPNEISRETIISGDGVTNASDEPYVASVKFKFKSGTNQKNYKLVNNIKYVNINIAKATFDVNLLQFKGKSVVYDGNSHYLTYNDSFAFLDLEVDNTAGYTKCGTYAVILTIRLLDTINYSIPTTTLIETLEITQLTLDVSNVKFKDKTIPYDGKIHSLNIENFEYKDISIDYVYYKNGEIVKLEDGGIRDAGTYNVVAKFVLGSNLKGNVTPISDFSAKLIISKKTIDFDKIIFENSNFVYDGTIKNFNVATSPYDIEFDYSSDGETNAGLYKIIAYPKLNDNFKIENYREISAYLNIAKASYNMDKIKFADIKTTYDGEIKSAKISGTLPKGVVCKYENNEHINAGNYIATAKFIIADEDNYEKIPDKTCNIEIEKRTLQVELEKSSFVYTGSPICVNAIITSGLLSMDVCKLELTTNNITTCGTYNTQIKTTNLNYKVNKSSYKYTIEKASINTEDFVFENIEVTYDGNQHTPKFIGDLPNGVVASVVSGRIVDVGEYVVYVDFTLIDNNYTKPNKMMATVKINKKPIVVQFSNYSNLIENGEEKSINVEFVGLIEDSFNDFQKVYSNTPITAGKYTMQVQLNENCNYEIIGNDYINFEILTTSKTYIDKNLQMQIESDGFSASSQISVSDINTSNLNVDLQTIGIKTKLFKAFAINMTEETIKKSIEVTIKTKNLNIKNIENVKIFKYNENLLKEIDCEVSSNQLVFLANIGDEIVIVEEKTDIENNENWIYIIATFSGLSMFSMVFIFIYDKKKIIKLKNTK